MALSANDVTVRLGMNEEVSDLVRQLDARDPFAVSHLVLTNCVLCDPAELCEQISRCVRLRRLTCVACTLQPSILLKLMLERLQYLQQLDFSLVEDSDVVVGSEINSMRVMAPQMWGAIQYHSLRRLYVEVGNDRNFELLWELLVFCPKLIELHVHLVRGNFTNALAWCSRFHDQLEQLEAFTFTSELPAYVPFPYVPDPPSTFKQCAAVCANVRHDKSHDWWSCVKLRDSVLSQDQSLILPSQLVAFASGGSMPDASSWEASHGHRWARVCKLCLLLLPERPTMVTIPRARCACRGYLEALFLALDSIVELNVSSFHVEVGVDLNRLLQETPLGSRLLALSIPPCWFPQQSSVRTLPTVCPSLRDLDVRVGTRGFLRCASCQNLFNSTVPVQEPSNAALSLSKNITRLTLCDMPYLVLLSYFQCYRAVTTLRLAGWRFVEGPQYGHLFLLLGKCGAIRCFVLQHEDLPINDQHFQASLSHMTSLQHLCLLTSMQLSDDDASQCAHASIGRSTRLKCVHIHYRRRNGGLERRFTWLNRGQGEILLREGPCFACCSTATFIGLVKPVNRDCEAGL
ncbi:hypothetical protein MTO96_002338 [Rhipicephalus appendiculatus]